MKSEPGRSDLDRITEAVIGSAFAVHNELGKGFLEKVYENAMAHEISKRGFKVQQQGQIEVRYDGVLVGDFAADLLVENSVLVELKAVRAFDDAHVAQCLNYLKATGMKICLLMNFGTDKVQVKRIVRDF